MKKGLKWAAWIIGVILLLALMLQITPVAEKAGEVVGATAERVKSVARQIILIAVGVYLVSTGVAALSVAPTLGVVLIVAGLAIAGFGIAPFFQKDNAG